MNDKVTYLQMIQSIISRMASNSFLLKGWTVTLVSALFALAAKDSNHIYFVLAYFPTIMLWVLDGYFLSQERLFRSLYNHARISTDAVEFSLDTRDFKNKWNGWASSFLSRTLIIFYGPIIIAILILTLGFK